MAITMQYSDPTTTDGEGEVIDAAEGVSLGPLAPPKVNVSLSGHIPQATETFRVDLPCSGLSSAEIFVDININVTSPRPRNPPIVIHLKRRKICLKGQSAEMYAAHQNPMTKDSETLPLVYYIVPGVVGVLLVLGIIGVVALVRRKMKGNQDHRILASDLGVKPHPVTTTTLLRPTTPNNNTYTLPSSVTINSYTSLRKLTTPLTPQTHPTPTPTLTAASRDGSRDTCAASRDGSRDTCVASRDGSRDTCVASRDGSRDTCQSSSSLSRSEVIVDPSAADLHERFRQLEVERRRVRLTAVIHEGVFARVYRGWIQRDRPEQDQQVLIKTLTENCPHEHVVALCHDGTQLFNLYHRNILTMAAISFTDNSPPYLIFPYHGYSNLKLYLQEHRGGHLRAAELVQLAVQAAHGLAFLHGANILHADLAARNCVVSEKLQLRITDAALSRDLFPSDYETSSTSSSTDAPRPIKWMAYEAITDRLFSTASDVWSYGVLLWELTTLAQQPYVEVDECEMSEYLRDGYRLSQPLNCPDDLYKVMAFCWAIHPHDRPHAKLILDYLAAFHQQLNSFI
ncbi:tyrosine-protein kinase RYK-like isoform X2 [Oratosquilla oratoria]|uniref:tyrosine-protein kinase RYK-like isoform X2 n=1 Tax=Oratosquilla oratoria TaxID=337810 RepID=UPI003F7757E7